MADHRIPTFEEQAGQACPPLDHLALALAAELRHGRADAAATDAALDALALAAMPAAGLTPHGQGSALAEATAGLRPAPRGRGTAAFAVDRVLQLGQGHPTVLAVVQAEVARRAGLDMTLAGWGRHLFVVHRHTGPVPVVVAPGGGPELVQPRDLPDALSWRCSHQAAFCVLGAVAREAVRCGDVPTAVRAHELRLALPVDASTREALERDLRAVRARLN